MKWYNENNAKPRSFKVAFITANETDPTCQSSAYDENDKRRCMPQFDASGQPVWTTITTKQFYPDKRYVRVRLDADPGTGILVTTFLNFFH